VLVLTSPATSSWYVQEFAPTPTQPVDCPLMKSVLPLIRIGVYALVPRLYVTMPPNGPAPL
jgi:hypothetical protein